MGKGESKRRRERLVGWLVGCDCRDVPVSGTPSVRRGHPDKELVLHVVTGSDDVAVTYFMIPAACDTRMRLHRQTDS